jgi:GMP synthase-like glutamine amidotransferase
MEPFEPAPGLLYLHQDQVMELPPGAVLLGRSEHCPVAIYRIDEQILCIQAHPELSRRFLAAVLDHRRPLIGEAKVDAALAAPLQPDSRTDGRPVDRAVSQAWLKLALL